VDDEHKRVPGGQTFKFSNHPRENVSWVDAVAFCRWLTEKATACPELLPKALRGQAKCEITLPTEWQWEKAARGQDGREYPYKGPFDAAKGNTWDTGIRRTSAVGIFPNGASPYGVLDMIGNVWEWCLNEDYNPANLWLNARVVRGGSWYSGFDGERAASRNNDLPYFRLINFGFRLVVRPAFSVSH